MKKFILFFLLISFSFPLFAQDDTTFSNKEEVMFSNFQKIGVFGGPSFKLAQVNRTVGLFSGGQGGVVLNNSLILGGAGYSLVTNVDASSLFEPKLAMNMDYGGLIIGYINNNNPAIHYTFEILIGGGEMSWSEKNDWLFFKGSNDNSDKFGRDAFFVIEPSLGIEMRLYKYFEMNFGISYLLASNVNSQISLSSDNGFTYFKNIGNKDLSGLSGMVRFKFGIPDISEISDVIVDIIDDFNK